MEENFLLQEAVKLFLSGDRTNGLAQAELVLRSNTASIAARAIFGCLLVEEGFHHWEINTECEVARRYFIEARTHLSSVLQSNPDKANVSFALFRVELGLKNKVGALNELIRYRTYVQSRPQVVVGQSPLHMSDMQEHLELIEDILGADDKEMDLLLQRSLGSVLCSKGALRDSQ